MTKEMKRLRNTADLKAVVITFVINLLYFLISTTSLVNDFTAWISGGSVLQ